MISGDIAIITSSGRAYYKLVTELKKRKITFLSLTPNQVIPKNVRVVITTERDQKAIDHPQVFVYTMDEDPSPVIDRVIQRLKGKDGYGQLVFGVDPGKRVGLVVMDDGSVVRTMILSSVEETAITIREAVNRMDAKEKIVKIGDGAPVYQGSLIALLDEMLPSDVVIESVEEKGTTRPPRGRPIQRRRAKDIYSAIRIARRNGREVTRRRNNA
jgi:hypothetical protein